MHVLLVAVVEQRRGVGGNGPHLHRQSAGNRSVEVFCVNIRVFINTTLLSDVIIYLIYGPNMPQNFFGRGGGRELPYFHMRVALNDPVGCSHPPLL